MSTVSERMKYPRRLVIRQSLRRLAHVAFAMLTDLEVIGKEYLPEGGPLLVAINHFSYLDPAAVIRAVPYPLEVIGGFRTPNAPSWGRWILKLWGYFPVFRGTGARGALRVAEAVLDQGGVLGIAPEGGSWATVLRPPRPGTAFLADRTGARILPIGIDGAPEVFPRLRRGRRARFTIRIGKPFGPLHATGHGRKRRQGLDEIGHTIMGRIAELIPPEKRGYYSDDPAIRAAARGTEVYPWASVTEG